MKTRINFTIDPTIKKDFSDICKENCINRSLWVETQIKEFIKTLKKGKRD